MGYEDGNELIDLYEWSMKWCCYLANVAVCKCLSDRATLIFYIAIIVFAALTWSTLTDFFSFDFLLLTSISFCLDCFAYCILSKLSMYLIEFTSKFYFTSTWASLSSIENKDTGYHYHTGMKTLKVKERTNSHGTIKKLLTSVKPSGAKHRNVSRSRMIFSMRSPIPEACITRARVACIPNRVLDGSSKLACCLNSTRCMPCWFGGGRSRVKPPWKPG